MSSDTRAALGGLLDSAYIAGNQCLPFTLQLASAQTLEESGAHRLRLYLGGKALPAPQLRTLAAWPRLSVQPQQCRHQYFLLLMPTSQTICCRYEAALVQTPFPPVILAQIQLNNALLSRSPFLPSDVRAPYM